MSGPPSLVVCGARVHGAADGDDAVAVADGRIAAVGPRRRLLAGRSPATRVLDVAGALVCPGFHDAHAHLAATARARLETDLHGMGLAAIRDAVAAAAAERAPGRWVVGRGFDPELFRCAPTHARDLLDAAAPHHPVLLRSHDYHAVALNTAGLRAAGFAPDPPDVEGGVTDRDDAGRPTGILREVSAFVASAHADDLTPAEVARATIVAAVEMRRAGVTAVHDMSGTRDLATLRALDDAGVLPVDVYATVSPGALGDADSRRAGTRLRIAGMKAFLDGALGSRTAHLLAPYEGETCHCGVEVLPRDRTLDAVQSAAALGLPSFLHAIGDAAVRTALDVLSAVAGPGGAALRHRVEHAQMIDDADLPRFAAHGIAASLQPVHIALDAPLVLRHWGARSRRAFPVRRLLDAGACVAFGSDTPIETFDVVAGMRCAVERVGRDGTPLHPEESVTPGEAIDAYTRGAARAAGADAVSGTVATGRIADLTLLSADVVRFPEALADTRVAATVVRGEEDVAP